MRHAKAMGVLERVGDLREERRTQREIRVRRGRDPLRQRAAVDELPREKHRVG